jgi:hypothetical protein
MPTNIYIYINRLVLADIEGQLLVLIYEESDLPLVGLLTRLDMRLQSLQRPTRLLGADSILPEDVAYGVEEELLSVRLLDKLNTFEDVCVLLLLQSSL